MLTSGGSMQGRLCEGYRQSSRYVRRNCRGGAGAGRLRVVFGHLRNWVHDVLSHLFKVNIKILSTHWSVMGVAPIIYKRKL